MDIYFARKVCRIESETCQRHTFALIAHPSKMAFSQVLTSPQALFTVQSGMCDRIVIVRRPFVMIL